MVEENEQSHISISNIPTERDINSLHSLMQEVLKTEKDNDRKFETSNSIYTSISAQYNKTLENNECEETSELCGKYFNAPKKIQYEHANSMRYHMEEIKLKKEIRELETKLNSSLLKNQMIPQEVLVLRKKRAITEEALCLAKKYYSSIWDMNIHIEDSKEDRFTCIINFKFDCGRHPIKFIIDRNNHKIINWDGSSLLNTNEESEMKERYSGTDHYFPKVLCELRLLVLNKIQMS